MIFFIIAFIIIILDQWTKWLVVERMELHQSIPLIDEILYLTSHRNPGAAFGILQNQRLFFIVVTTIVVIYIVYLLIKNRHRHSWLTYGLALILGGAIGNFIDRLLTGEVVDFIDVKIIIFNFYYDFPIFNVADSALVIGVGMLIIDTIREGLNERRKNITPTN